MLISPWASAMDFQSAMETFAEAWMAANTKSRPESSEMPQPTQREETTERTNGTAEEGSSPPRENAIHLTNGNSPSRGGGSPASLPRESEGSPRPSNNCSTSTTSRIIPIRVVLESVAVGQSNSFVEVDLRGRVEVDSYAMIPSHTRFSDLLPVALGKVGYLDDLPYARGLLQLRNWRPLPLETIPESEDKTVLDVLADFAPLATLLVRVYSSTKLRCARDIKDRLLRLLLTQSHHLLAAAGCPLDESLLGAIIRGNGEVSEEVVRQFEGWWAVQVAHASRPPPPNPSHLLSQAHHPSPHSVTHPLSLEKLQSDPLHPALQQTVSSPYNTQKTRMRTSFDPEYELPRLHRWFAENQHPTRLQIQQYVAELNMLESRRGRKPLDINNVVYWFKNARAAYKRQEFRVLNGIKTPPLDEVGISDNEDAPENYSSHPLAHPLSLINNHSSPTSQSQPTTPSRDHHLHHNPPSQHNSQESNDGEDRKPSLDNLSNSQGRSQPPTSTADGDFSGNAIKDVESDVDMSDDDDDCRSRDSSHVDVKSSPSPVVSPGALSLPPYPPIPGLGQPGGMDRLPYPVVPGSLFQHSMMYMAQYMPQVSPFSGGLGAGGIPEERRKRNRTFIDPVTEVPRLEQWFNVNTHPSHNLILKYTEELNRMPYRQKFPKLEPKNVQFWFKNRRAKCKRLRVLSKCEVFNP